ncbi:hypothetical protein, partial [Pseudomonas helleri]
WGWASGGTTLAYRSPNKRSALGGVASSNSFRFGNSDLTNTCQMPDKRMTTLGLIPKLYEQFGIWGAPVDSFLVLAELLTNVALLQLLEKWQQVSG